MRNGNPIIKPIKLPQMLLKPLLMPNKIQKMWTMSKNGIARQMIAANGKASGGTKTKA